MNRRIPQQAPVGRRQPQNEEDEHFFEQFPQRPPGDQFPFRNHQQPVFAVDVHRFDNYPIGVQMEWVDQGNLTENETITALIETFRREIFREVHEIHPNWREAFIGDQVRIRLGVLVPWRGDVFLPPGDQFPWFHLDNLNHERFYRVIERMAESNANLTFFNLQWHVTILQTSIRDGGAGKKGLPAGFTKEGLAEKSVISEENECCAIKAFLFANRKYLVGHVKGISNIHVKENDQGEKYCRRIANELQRRLNWGNTVLIDNLGELVGLPETSHIRLVLLFLGTTRGIAYEGKNWEIDRKKPEKNTIYIIFHDGHYIGVLHPRQFYINLPSKQFNSEYYWCHVCLRLFKRTDSAHQCEYIKEKRATWKRGDKCNLCRKVKKEDHTCPRCEHCGEVSARNHLCNHVYCEHCKTQTPLGNEDPFTIRQNHRCPIYFPCKSTDTKEFVGEPPRPKFDNNDDDDFSDTGSQAEENNVLEEDLDEAGEIDQTKSWTVLAYDLECRMTYTREKNVDLYATGPAGKVTILRRKERPPPTRHTPNLVVAQNVFDLQDYYEFKTIREFIEKLEQQEKKNFICIAHNGAGYDTRLVFAELIRSKGKKPSKCIFRGTKIVYMSYENIVFLDSMLHLQGSLAVLGKEFGLPPELLKGHFPHKLNREGAPEYWTSIPPFEEYCDLRFISSQEALDELRQWYDEQPKDVPWILSEELLKYCRQDVDVLAEILRKYHNDIVKICGISPLGIPTSAGLSHKMFLRRYLAPQINAKITYPNCTCRDDNSNTKTNACFTFDTANTWVKLTQGEYFFARSALRGGRTDVRRPYLHLDDAALARGERIKYIDIVSMYPTVQITEDYPVGPPFIELFVDSSREDGGSSNPRLFAERHLFCELQTKYQKLPYNVTRIIGQPHPNVLKEFFGFIMADVTPPNDLYHPVLVHYDHKENKCLASLNKISQCKTFKNGERAVFTSVEFQAALEVGYKVDWVYAIHHYKKAPSLWKDMLLQLARLKIENSGLPPDCDEDAYREAYKRKGIVLGEIQDNKSKKATYKGPLNSAWGKCCENPAHEHMDILSSADSYQMLQLELKEQKRMIEISGINPLGAEYTMVRSRPDFRGSRVKTDSTFIPAGVFVPAYGRLMLWRAMHKLGERVLMHDTDSIVYHHIPGEEHLAPKTGSLLGDWELDKIHRKGDVFEFLGLGPKSYGLAVKGLDGKISHQMKMKGISMKLSTQADFNYNEMKRLVLKEIENVHVYNMRFNFSMKILDIVTADMRKIIQGNDPKGELVGDFIYPHGHKAIPKKSQKRAFGDDITLEEIGQLQNRKKR